MRPILSLIVLTYQFLTLTFLSVIGHFFIAYELDMRAHLDHVELYMYGIAAVVEMILYHSWKSIHGKQ